MSCVKWKENVAADSNIKKPSKTQKRGTALDVDVEPRTIPQTSYFSPVAQERCTLTRSALASALTLSIFFLSKSNVRCFLCWFWVLASLFILRLVYWNRATSIRDFYGAKDDARRNCKFGNLCYNRNKACVVWGYVVFCRLMLSVWITARNMEPSDVIDGKPVTVTAAAYEVSHFWFLLFWKIPLVSRKCFCSDFP